ncbi:MAG TPA: mechanosensitive ion channel family protein [Candidatus Acidoferrum sp.]|jgi:MscS family membrane protein|nr:mechanosensitive ion channel family protein [Candidatus Acidoferrum sp.]
MNRFHGVPKMFVHRPLLLAFFLLGFSSAALPQIPGLTTPQPAPAAKSASAVPPDPLGRETPRGTLLGFIKAAQEEEYAKAVEYFQPPSRRRRSEQDDEELAAQLLTIFNQKFAGALELTSPDPIGRLDDGLLPDQERITGALGTTDKFPIQMIRLADEQGRKLWYFSRSTLDHVPEMYESLTFPEIEKQIPQTLVSHRLLFMPLWQWIAIGVFLPVALLGGRLITMLLAFGVNRSRKARNKPPLAPQKFFQVDPITLTIAIVSHYIFVGYIGTSLLYRLYYRKVVWVFLAFDFYWILTSITRAIASRIGSSLTRRGMLAERSIVSLIRRFTQVSIFLLVTLLVLKNLGVDVSTALAGIGIGSLALGLGAQKTFENLFGGVSILFDKVIQIGDTCRINNQAGVVEDIGLRSTRLRTAERTLLSIPNGIMASAVVENLRFRDKFLCQQTIRLRYDLSPDHVRYVLGQIQNLLIEDPKVEDPSARVRFLRFAEYALEVEIYCYILEPEYNHYLATQEQLLLKIMDAIEKAGAVVALPTQTTFVTQDSWIDPQKAKAAEAAVEKARDPGVPGLRAQPPSD